MVTVSYLTADPKTPTSLLPQWEGIPRSWGPQFQASHGCLPGPGVTQDSTAPGVDLPIQSIGLQPMGCSAAAAKPLRFLLPPCGQRQNNSLRIQAKLWSQAES